MNIHIIRSLILNYHESVLVKTVSRKFLEKWVRASYNGDNYQFNRNGESWLIRHLSDYWKVRKVTPTIYDCGANVGDWTRSVLRESPDAQIHCFEPVPQIHEMLSDNLRNCKDVELNNFGLSEKEGEIELWEHTSENICTTSKFQKYNTSDRKIRVRMMRGDSYTKKQGVERIHALKIDAEGMDYEVLAGMGDLIRDGKIDVIQFELIECGSVESPSIKDYLQLLINQYEVGRLYPKAVKFRNWKEPWTREMISESKHNGNYVAVSRQCPEILESLTSGWTPRGSMGSTMPAVDADAVKRIEP